jgi:hypothetical protein
MPAFAVGAGGFGSNAESFRQQISMQMQGPAISVKLPCALMPVQRSREGSCIAASVGSDHFFLACEGP